MKKIIYFSLINLICLNSIFSQVGINTDNPEGALDVTSSNAGILIPRIALSDITIASPVINPETGNNNLVNSTLIYNTSTTSGSNGVTPGFYYWQSNHWVRISSEVDFDKDWLKVNSSLPSTSINDDIFTNGKVGIGIGQNEANLRGALHVYEATGTAPSPDNGSILLEHGNTNGESSIVFRSRSNAGNDYAYISYQDDGSSGSTNENGLLEIGIQNDGANIYRDNINLRTSSSVGINNTNPSISASLDMGTTNQGILINRVALSSLTDTATIVGTEANGLLVYNTTAAGTSPNNVVEGFYFWKDNKWNLLKASANETPNRVQFYSYNISPQSSPNIASIETNNVISKSGPYTGALNSTSAMSTMKPSNNDGFVIKIVGTYEVKTAGNFSFSSTSDDGARLYIDNSLITNAWSDSSGNTTSGSTYLGKGKHQFVFWFYDNTGGHTFSFNWGTNPDNNSGVIQANQFTVE